MTQVQKIDPQFLLENKNKVKLRTPIEKMKAMSVHFSSEVSAILDADAILSSSEVLENGKKKHPAKRGSVEKAFPKFEALIINQMAHSAYLLAQFWDEIYEKAGEPSLKQGFLRPYPFTPPFIAPDYLKKKKR